MVLRTSDGTSTYVEVVISPDTTTKPVVMSVSHATCPCGSSRRTASKHGVRYLVGDLVRMPLAHRFGSEQKVTVLHSYLRRSHYIERQSAKQSMPSRQCTRPFTVPRSTGWLLDSGCGSHTGHGSLSHERASLWDQASLGIGTPQYPLVEAESLHCVDLSSDELGCVLDMTSIVVVEDLEIGSSFGPRSR